MNRTIKNSYLVKVLVFVVALVVLGISTTYAYFTLNITGTPNLTTVGTGTLQIDSNLKTVTSVSNPNLIEKGTQADNAQSVSFYLENNSTKSINAKYNIYLTNITITKNFFSKYFKWELERNGSVVYSGDFSTLENVGTSSDENNYTINKFLLNSEEFTLNNGERDNLIFRIWLENDNVDQTSLTRGSFSAKLFYEAVPVR